MARFFTSLPRRFRPSRQSHFGLGRLHTVQLTTCFPGEATHFTPWLAQEDNLAVLSEALQMELEVEGTEVSVGPFSCDIVASDGEDIVVIENQFGRTDHRHLGQVLTYAAGLRARAVVWICERFTEEHRQALDYLNEVTSDDLRFFGVEVRLWKIGDSIAAPQFQLVAKPNDFQRAIASARRSQKQLTGGKQLYLEFWTALVKYVAETGCPLNVRKPQPQNWMSIAIGRSGFHLSLLASAQKRRIGVELYLKGRVAVPAFAQLKVQREPIEAITGHLEWNELPGKRDSRIIQFQPYVDLEDSATWRASFEWMTGKAQEFDRAFRGRVRAIDLSKQTSSTE